MNKKHITLSATAACLCLAANAITIENTEAGALKVLLAGHESDTQLTITGTMNAADFNAILEEMPVLTSLDISDVTIAAYDGDKLLTGTTTSPANAIPDFAFVGTALQEITFPTSITAIGHGACAGLNIANVTIPATVKTIGDAAFSGNSAITTITLPAALQSLGMLAFKECSNLKTVTVSSPLTAIAKQTFMNCTALTQVGPFTALATIGDEAFDGCSNLATFAFPATLSSIGTKAFYGTALTDADLSAGTSALSIGNWAFAACSNLEGVQFPADMKNLGQGAFYSNGSLTLQAMPADITTIPAFAFTGIDKVDENALLSAKVDSIQAYALADWKYVQRLVLPYSLEYIGDEAMANWTGITEIAAASLTEVPVLGENVWGNLNKGDVKLIVNQNLLNDFKSADQWQDFHIEAGTTTENEGVIMPEVDAETSIKVRFEGMVLHIDAATDIAAVQLYDVDGRAYNLPMASAGTHATVDTECFGARVMIVRILLTDGSAAAMKLSR